MENVKQVVQAIVQDRDALKSLAKALAEHLAKDDRFAMDLTQSLSTAVTRYHATLVASRVE